MTDDFKNMVFSKDNFFINPDKILTLFDREQFFQSAAYPGQRTGNLLESNKDISRNFGLFCSKKICDEIFPGIHGLMIDIRLHINTVYHDSELNQGWIHADDADLAGLIYLSKNEDCLDTGTSIFNKKIKENFSSRDITSRQEFNVTGVATDEYKKDLYENHSMFSETIRIGNVYNRLVAYDATLFHRPNRYNLDSLELRRSIVFFIKGFKRTYESKINIMSSWEDV
jgi:hypothetical protein